MRATSVVALLVGLAACGGKDAPGPADATSTRPAGQVRRADHWVPVSAQVLHDAKMDLAVRCRLLRDEAKAKGRDIALCFETTARPERPVTRIAVLRESDLGRAMHRLTALDEGVHFVVDKSGAIYQVLDLAFAARHGGAYPEDEIRVVACDEAAAKTLIGALQALYPGAAIVEEPGGASP